MPEHTFMVTVDVTGWDAGSDRSEADYAAAAVNLASLPDAARLDGYADLSAEASVITVESLDPA